MSAKVDLYNSSYSNYEAEAYRHIRVETYGQDLGQTSWVSAEESEEIPGALALTPESLVLEIGSGSGRYALQVAERTGCRIVGVDVNEPGIRNANHLAAAARMTARVLFEVCDVSKTLPFPDEHFDAMFSNDVFCHVPGRLELLCESFRVLKSGGRLAFSDALVIGGAISHQEIAARSSIGYYIFSPPGENERLLRRAGFHIANVKDTTASASEIAKRWRDAREKRKRELIAAEGQSNYGGVQQFLATVHLLTSERRLLRFLYLAQK